MDKSINHPKSLDLKATTSGKGLIYSTESWEKC
jgi:hypothetical protein